MKIAFPRLLLPLLAVAALAACIRIPKQPKNRQDTSPLTYRFDGGADLTSLFTLKATYVGADGRTKSEQINSLLWSKEIAVKAPFNAQLSVRFKKNQDYSRRDRYAVGYSGSIDYGATRNAFTPPLGTTRASGPENVIRLRFALPDGVSADDVSLRFAPLKYDKHFAFTFTCDDSWTNAYSRIWSLINGKWIDDREFNHPGAAPTTGRLPDYPLTMTDGCGNDRRFAFSCAIWPSWGNEYNPTFVKPLSRTGVNSIYISWEELGLLSDFGVSMLYHNVDERIYDKTDPAQIAWGLSDDYDKVFRNLGLRMKVLGLPDGNAAYAQAAQQSDRVLFTRNSLNSAKRIYLHTCGDLRKAETYGGDNNSMIDRKLAELAKQAASDNPYWVGITVHRCGEDYMQMLDQIYRLYGKAGSDALWAASWDEIYEYVAMREGARISKSVEGRTVTFEIEVPLEESFWFRDISLLVDGLGGKGVVEPLSDNIVGLVHAPRNGGMLVNVNFNPRLPALAEKYTAAYEREFTDAALSDARYFVSQLLPELAEPFEQRLGAVVAPSEAELDAERIEAYRTQLDGYTATVRRDIAAAEE